MQGGAYGPSNSKGLMAQKTDYTLLLVALVAMFNCLVRSDYNLIVAFVCYYFWKASDNKTDRISFVIKILLAIVQVFDIIWFLVIWSSWTGHYASKVWQSYRFWHIFVIITSLVNFVLKFLALAFVFMESKQTRQQGGYQPLSG